MHYIVKILLVSILLVICDIPWLLFNKSWFVPMMSKIQGASVRMILWPTIIIYPALAYLLLEADSVLKAAIYGASTYAVYDFTNLATIQGYEPAFAVADTVWGGILFAVVKSISNILI